MTYSLTCGIQSERPRYKRDTGSSPFFLSSFLSCLLLYMHIGLALFYYFTSDIYPIGRISCFLSRHRS